DRASPGWPSARSVRERWTAGTRARWNRSLLLELCHERLGGRGVWSLRGEFQIGLEFRGRARHVALVHERHAELIVRFRVIRVRGDSALEGFLGVGDLAGVPQDHALVVLRIGIAATAAG